MVENFDLESGSGHKAYSFFGHTCWGELLLFEGIALGVAILSLLVIVWLFTKISGLRNTMSDLKPKWI